MLDDIAHWLRGFAPPPGTASRLERLRACAGALIGLFLTGLLSHLIMGSAANVIWLIAPMGASAVLLFGVPASPLAQPWSILGGNLSAALVGVTCQYLIPNSLIAASLAAALAIGVMFALRCLHPPSGAVALTAVLGGPAVHAMGYGFVFGPVAIDSLLLLGAALVYNNLTGRRYPNPFHNERVNRHDTVDAVPTARLGFGADDLDAVLKNYAQVIDISRDDLQSILEQTEMRGYQRRFGALTCATMMSRDMITVAFGTELDAAWQLMQQHKVKALPVIDQRRRLIGIVTKSDFLKHADLGRAADFAHKLRALIRRNRFARSAKPQVVGQIMSTDIITAHIDKPLIELVPLMADAGLHQVPVVDGEGLLAGMLTQSDMIAALYESALHNK